LIASFAAAEVTRLIETKGSFFSLEFLSVYFIKLTRARRLRSTGLDHLDKAKAQHEAKKQAEHALKECGDY